MAEVAVLVRIYPKDTEKVDALISEIKEKLKPVSIETEELAFGIKAVKALFYENEKEGSSGLEKKLGETENVSNIEVLGVDRLG